MTSRAFLGHTLIVAAAAFLAACGDGSGPRRENMRPTVMITVPGPAERLPYTTRFEWTGADSDGVVDHFEYVVDVPDSVTLDDLDNPDYTGVAWTATTADGMLFTFSTPFPDTAGLPGTTTA